MSVQNTDRNPKKTALSENSDKNRRDFLSRLLMGGGLLAGYGTLLIEGGLFLMPPDAKPATRKLFMGKVSHFKVGHTKNFYDLEGNLILIRREKDQVVDGRRIPRLSAFSSICPHLGCMVKWQPKRQEFFCPCHNGIFDAQGVAIAGPPAKANQRLTMLPIIIDQQSQRVYMEVRDPERNA